MTDRTRQSRPTRTPDPVLTLEAKLIDEAESQAELGRPFNRVVETTLRALAERARAEGLTTEAEFLARYPLGIL